MIVFIPRCNETFRKDDMPIMNEENAEVTMNPDEITDLSERIKKILVSEVSSIIPGKTALGFSGGLDSTLLMGISNGALIPYTVGFSNSKDIANSRIASLLLGIKSNEICLDSVDLKGYLELLKEIDHNIRRDEIGYELVLTILMDRIKEKEIVTGQGSDELFYGYRRFIEEPELTNRTHMEKLMGVTLPREEKIADYFGKKILTPYLNREIVDLMKDVPKGMNITNGVNKVILREVARSLGLPEEIIQVKKKAAQYGSGINNRLPKIMRQL